MLWKEQQLANFQVCKVTFQDKEAEELKISSSSALILPSWMAFFFFLLEQAYPLRGGNQQSEGQET